MEKSKTEKSPWVKKKKKTGPKKKEIVSFCQEKKICFLRSLRRKPLLSLVIPVIVLQWSQKCTIYLEQLRRGCRGHRLTSVTLFAHVYKLRLWIALTHGADKKPSANNFYTRITANVSTKINKFKIYERFAVTAYFFLKKIHRVGNFKHTKFG